MHRGTLTQKTLLTLLVLSAGLWLRGTSEPYIGPVTYQFDGKEEQTTTHPFFVKAEAEYLNVTFPMVLTRLQSTTLLVKPDDCLEELSINDVAVQHPAIPFCDYTHPGKEMDLSAYLSPGLNVWKMRIRDTGGDTGVRIAPALRGWIPIIDFLIVFIVIAYIASLRRSVALFKKMGTLFPLLLGGVAVRILYVLSTGYNLRGHDTWAHIDYIEYIAEHGALPAAHAGWEFHQAPLYYIFSAIVRTVSSSLGITVNNLNGVIQIESLLASAGIVLLACIAALMLYPRPAQSKSRYIFAAIIICSPALIFLSSRITNNGLYVFFGSLSIVQLLRWWKSDSLKDWYILAALLAVTALTKVSGLALVGAVALAWISRHGRDRDMWRFALIGGILFTLLFSWFPLSRLGNDEDTKKLVQMGNVGMHSGLNVENTVTNLTTFHPVAILHEPYNNPWSDDSRRQYFWEYFFRSAFFGEFSFDSTLKLLAQGMLLTGILSLIVFACGLIASLWKRTMYDMPMALTLLCLLSAALAYRLLFPYSANQDFRQSVLLLFPIAYFITKGCAVFSTKKTPLLEKCCTYSVLACCYISLLFIVLLFWYR